MDRVLIEEYRGVEIYFNLESETFYATIDDSEGNWNKPKKTYTSCKKAIDDYIKENSEFAPFTVIYRAWNGPLEKRTICGIRKDGRFNYIDAKGMHQQISTYDETKYLIDTPENITIIDEINKVNLEIDVLHEKRAALDKSLIVVNLKDIKAKYIR